MGMCVSEMLSKALTNCCQSIAASDFHPQIAVGSADGTCQTTNMMKSTRRGGAVVWNNANTYQLHLTNEIILSSHSSSIKFSGWTIVACPGNSECLRTFCLM